MLRDHSGHGARLVRRIAELDERYAGFVYRESLTGGIGLSVDDTSTPTFPARVTG